MSTEIPMPGQVYRHFKGGLYTVIAVALNQISAEHEEQIVVYEPLSGGQVWARSLENWNELVGDETIKRFALFDAGER